MNNIKFFSKEPDFVENYSSKMIYLKDVMNKFFFNPYFMFNVFNILEFLESSFHNDKWYKELKEKNDLEEILKNCIENEEVVYNLNNCFNIKMIEKKCYNIDNLDSFMNEYYIGTKIINYLRFIIPNFVFTFYLEQKKLNIYKNPPLDISKNNCISVFSEYIDSISFKNFNNLIIENNNYLEFLSVFFQIICSLEVAQQTFQFTHNDCHIANILIRPNYNNEIIEYPIFDEIYEFKTSIYIPTIIDFGYSVGKTNEKKNIFNSINFPEYGYFPFFIPGTDIVRICINLYVLNYEKSSPIKKFLEFILEKFFKINLNEFLNNADIISEYYYNFFHSQSIYKNPLELLNFCHYEYKTIFEIFSISSFPMTIHKNSNSPIEFIINKNKKFENENEILEYLNILSLQKVNLKKKLYNYFTPSKFPKYIFTKDLINNLPNIKFPNILFNSDFSNLYYTLMKYNWYIENYEYFLYILLFDKTKYSTSQINLFLENICSLTSIYRNLCFLNYFLNFVKNNEIKINKNTLLYQKIIQKIFNS